MNEPPSPTVGVAASLDFGGIEVVCADEQHDVALDVDRWARLAGDVLQDEQAIGELTLTFVDRDEMADLNREHMGGSGPTDVLSFPLDAPVEGRSEDELRPVDSVLPVLLGDVVVCPSVAQEQSSDHAGSIDDEIALLVIHGVLHVLGHDHAEPDECARMRARELELLQTHHWGGPPPAAFRQEHIDP